MQTANLVSRLLCSAVVVGCAASVVNAEQPRPEISVVVSGVVVSGVVSSISAGGATANVAAARQQGPQPASTCQQVAFNVGLSHASATQVVVVLTPSPTSTAGTLQVAQRGPRGWECGAALTARVGVNGVRPLLQRRSGDGTTPGGVFPMGVMTAWDGETFSLFGNSPDPGAVAGPYRRVQAGDCFGATANHPDYGHLVYRAANDCPGPDDEYLPAIGSTYEHAVLIGANMEPNVSGDAPGEVPYAAAIFLHRFSFDANGNSKATSGCVSLSHASLVTVVQTLQPGVLFAIGDAAWLLENT